MLNFGKAARLILAATAPVLAVAQAPQAPPVPQPRPAYRPGPATQPRPQAAPSSQQFVTSETFFRANQKPSPGSTGSTAAQGVVPIPATARPPQPKPAMPQGVQSAVVAPVPALTNPQPPAVQPAVTVPASSRGAQHDGTTAVDYAQGQLSVLSQNAPLGVVLKLVAAKTGAIVDLAPELQNEPVFAQLGPGSVREVMTRLLDSPRIDYIVMGTGADPGGLQRVVVRARHSFGRVAMATVRPQPKPQEAEEEPKLENGHLANGLTPAEAKLTQEQLMENWKKTREQMRQAEIEQQRQDRETEKTQPQTEPQPEPQQPENPQPDNPPQK